MNLILSKKSIVYLILFVTMFSDLIISFFPALSFFRYVSDLLIIIALLLTIKNKIKFNRVLLLPIVVYFVITLVSLFVNFVDIKLYFWAFRNTFRFFIFYIICINSLGKEDILKIINIVIKLNYINFILVIFEFLVLGYKGDHLGGLFGFEQGCNGSLNVFLVIVSTLLICPFFSEDKKTKTKSKLLSFIISLLCCIISASLSELKFYFIELIIILLFALILYKFSIKKVIIAVVSFVMLFQGIMIMSNYFPQFKNFFISTDEVLNYINSTGDNNVTIIGRGTFYNQINNTIFNNSITNKIIGKGFGSAEMSSNFSFFNSTIYYQYGQLGYRNISSSMIYLETGLLGLISYLMFYISVMIKSVIHRKRNWIIGAIAIISFILILNVFYNSTSRREITYLSMMFLSFIPIIIYETEGDLNE